MTVNHMRNCMDCVRNRKQPNAPVKSGYDHSVANIMITAALLTGQFVTFNDETQEVMAGGEVFKYCPQREKQKKRHHLKIMPFFYEVY